MSNGEYIVIGEYINSKIKIKLKHIKCGHAFNMLPASFTRGRRCPKCYGTNKKTTESFKNELYTIVGDEYLMLDEYVNNKTKITLKHTTCGGSFQTTPINFQNGNRCPFCSKTAKKTTEQFKQEFDKISKGEYILLNEYTTSHSKIKVKHTKCDSIFEVRSSHFLTGTRCPYCKTSKGEKLIMEILKNNNIDFESQYRFSDCKNIKPLPFDFYLKDKNILIEYDGSQHNKPFSFGSKTSQKIMNQNFIDLMIRDDIKTNFALNNNIKLIRINYTEFDNIENILLSKI